MKDLEEVLKNLKEGKCRDPDGLIREIFMEGIIGTDLKKSMLILFNKILGLFPLCSGLPIFMPFIKAGGK